MTNQRGFSLLELMISIGIMGIITVVIMKQGELAQKTVSNSKANLELTVLKARIISLLNKDEICGKTIEQAAILEDKLGDASLYDLGSGKGVSVSKITNGTVSYLTVNQKIGPITLTDLKIGFDNGLPDSGSAVASENYMFRVTVQKNSGNSLDVKSATFNVRIGGLLDTNSDNKIDTCLADGGDGEVNSAQIAYYACNGPYRDIINKGGEFFCNIGPSTTNCKSGSLVTGINSDGTLNCQSFGKVCPSGGAIIGFDEDTNEFVCAGVQDLLQENSPKCAVDQILVSSNVGGKTNLGCTDVKSFLCRIMGIPSGSKFSNTSTHVCL